MDIDGDFVIDQLERVCADTKIHRNDIAIVCPFHADSSPSCMVHTSGHKFPVGVFHCWSCGASGTWSKLAERLGLDAGESYVSDNPFGSKSRALKRRLEEAEEHARDQFDGHMPKGHQPWEHGGFRGLSEEFLLKVGARRYYDDKSECHRIVFPVKNKNGVIIGSASRRLDKSKSYTWMNSRGPWARKALYPIHILPKPLDRVVLVEGPFDALRLNYLGIPALAIMGTENWSWAKVSTLQGIRIEKVIICMDGDKAGRVAEAKIFNELDGVLKRKRFRLPIENPPIDPGNMDMEKVEALREFAGF